jgi:uncharacterized protein YegJ (DUF2314 family)
MNPTIKTPDGDVIGVPPSDADMQLASRQARDTFVSFREQFDKRDPACSIFIVKVFYPDPKVPDGGEHLWLTAHSVSDSSASGVITSRPMLITTLKLRDKVEVKLPQLSDWLYVRDGRAVGGYTATAPPVLPMTLCKS